MSRGIWLYMGARTRRSLTLLWAALFVLSLGLQYMSFAAPQTTLAVHDEGLFELDGNAVTNHGGSGLPDDWDRIYGDSSNAIASDFITDPINRVAAEHLFQGGGSKDGQPISAWKWTTGAGVQDKNDIENAYAAAYANGDGHRIVYFGQDRYATSGDAFVGFWFLQDQVSEKAGGTFNGAHVDGDILVQVNFTNGGAIQTFLVSKWQGGGLVSVASGVECSGSSTDYACGKVNGDGIGAIDSPWPFTAKSPDAADPTGMPQGSFFEGGIDLTHFGLDDSCFSTFVAETRSSQSLTSTLSDYALGGFSFCKPPKITTSVSTSTINVGESVTDTADLTGNNPTPAGTIDFYVCGPSAQAPDCSTGGTKVGGTKTLSGGTATSDAFTVSDPAKTGTYCFRAEYTPTGGSLSKYLPGSHTNKTTECFEVIPAGIDLTKTADKASVSAGDQIGFTLSISSTGPGTAAGVKVSDTLPTTAGTSWSIDAAGTTGPWAIGNGVLSFGGASGVSMPSGTEYHVHVVSGTTPASCGTVDNTANATTTNDGSDSASASVNVLCPDIKVTKTPDGGSVQAGDDAVFTIVVENIGAGVARDVHLTDTLPTGFTWTPQTDTGSCSITNGVLDCALGDMAAGAKATVTLTAPTDGQDCGSIPNTASATATNEAQGATGNNSDSGSITVLCAQIDITKTANPVGPVSAGDTIGFDIVVANNGNGEARNVTVTDTLPTTGGTSWSVSPAVAGCSISAGVLTCDLGTMAAGASKTIHLTSGTTAASCTVVNNTASVTTSNDGSDTDDASVTVLCPDVAVTKTADPVGPVNAGDQIGFVVTISNVGQGVAKQATAADTLPAGIAWAIDGAANGWSLQNGVLSFGPTDLASGASASVRVVGTTDAADCGTVPNTVTGSALYDTNPANDSASASVLVYCPDVRVIKTADESPISAGEIASFTIQIANLGPGTAYDVTLEDQLPAGVAWSLDQEVPGCSIVDGLLSCTFDQLDVNAIFLHVVGETDLNDCGTLPNTATVGASNEPADKLGNNTSSASIVVDCPVLGITKTAVPLGPVNAGDQIGFEVMIKNSGEGTAFGVSVDDPLPAGFTWTIDASSDPGWSISAGHLVFGPASLAAGAESTVLVTAGTTAESCGIVKNVATIYQSQAEVGQDDASVVVDCPDVAVTKTADAPVVSAGQSIGFTVTVSNIGPGAATGVTFTDALPAGSGVAWMIDPASAGWSITGSAPNQNLVFSPTTLAAGASSSVHVTSVTTAASCKAYPNTATIDAANEPNTAEYTANNSASASTEVLCAAIGITKTASAQSVVAGEDIAFTVTATNSGAGTAKGVQVSDPLPDAAGLAWTITSGDEGWSIVDGELVWSGDLAAGDSVTVTVTSPTTRESCGLVDNTASVTTTNDGSDEASASMTVTCPVLAIDKSNDAPLVDIGDGVVLPTLKEGESATFTLDYTLTDGPVTDGLLTDVLPDGLAYVDGTASSNDEFTFVSYDAATRTLTWTAPTVTKDGTLTYKAMAETGAADLAQPLTNVATISSAQTPKDSDTSDVYVPAEPEPVTSSPTPPPTDTLDTPQSGAPGFTLMLVLLALAGFALVLGFVTPVPERVRRRDRLG